MPSAPPHADRDRPVDHAEATRSHVGAGGRRGAHQRPDRRFDTATDPPSWRRALRSPWAAAALAIALGIVAAFRANANGTWTPPFYFDEMWRTDFVRSSHPIERMLTHNTPVPIGWVELTRLITAPLPYKPVVFRVVSLTWLLLGVGVLTELFRRLTQRVPRGDGWLAHRTGAAWMSAPVPFLAVPVGVGLVCFFYPPVAHYMAYFNNYTFEVFYMAVVVFAAHELDRGKRWPFPTFCVLTALTPVFVIGGLFALPALVVCAACWVWRGPRGRRVVRLAALGASCLSVAVISAVTWVKLYKPVSTDPRPPLPGEGSISDFWITQGASLGGEKGLGELLRYTYEQIISNMTPANTYQVVSVYAYATRAALFVGVVVGIVVVARRWPWLLAMILSAWLFTIGASAFAHWPMTLERVNLCWQIFFLAMCAIGLTRAVLWLTPSHPSLAIPALVVCFAVLWFEPADLGPTAFARKLTADLGVIAGGEGQHNIVFQYHRLAHFYTDNELINTGHGDKTFDIIPQVTGDASLYSPLDPYLESHGAKVGDVVWCVVPMEVGPEGENACTFNDRSRLQWIVDYEGGNSHINGYRIIR